MDFTLTEAQQDLSGLSRTISEKLSTVDRQKELDAARDRFDAPLWRALAEAGALSAALPAPVGGDGLGVLEQCSVLRELGRTLCAVPYLSSIVMGAATLAEFGSDAQRSWARRAASGDAILAAAVDEDGGTDPFQPATRAVRRGDGWVLTGRKTTVEAAPIADLLLVPASTPEGAAVFLVDPSDDQVTVERQQLVDRSCAGLIELREVPVAAGDVLGRPGDGRVVEWMIDRGTVGLCALQSGVLERALELASGYARERVQFDRPIGSFQAVAQRLADAYIDVQAAQLSMWQAAWSIDAGEVDRTAVHTAKFWAADAGHRVAHTMVHVHGGVGLDRDHPVHRYFLAAKRNEFWLGSASSQLQQLGTALAER